MPKTEFPMWVYHADFPNGKLVHSAGQLKALAKNVVDSPAKIQSDKSDDK